MNTELHTILTFLLGGTNVLSVFMYFGERARRKAETRIKETDVVAKIQEVYTKYVEDDQNRYEELLMKYEDVRKRVAQLEGHIRKFERKCINNCGA